MSAPESWWGQQWPAGGDSEWGAPAGSHDGVCGGGGVANTDQWSATTCRGRQQC